MGGFKSDEGEAEGEGNGIGEGSHQHAGDGKFGDDQFRATDRRTLLPLFLPSGYALVYYIKCEGSASVRPCLHCVRPCLH